MRRAAPGAPSSPPSRPKGATNLEPDSSAAVIGSRNRNSRTSPSPPAQLQSAFVLSNAETKRLNAIAQLPPVSPAFRDAERQTLLYWHGADAVIDKALLTWSSSNDPDDHPDWLGLIAAARSWIAPDFPIGGKDLLEAGVAEGQELGRCLQALEDWWVAGGFSADKAALISRLSAIRR